MVIAVSTFRNNSAGSGPEHTFLEQDGKLFGGWVDQSGTIGASRFNGQAWRHALVDDAYSVDIHNSPTLCFDSANKLLIAYCNHQSSAVYVRKAATAYGLDFGSATQVSVTTNAAYPNMVRTTDGRIWLFYAVSGGNRPVYYQYSDDDGATWSSVVQLWNPSSGGNCYYQVTAIGNEIVALMGNGHPHDDLIAYGEIDGFCLRWNGSAWVDIAGGAVTLPETPRAGLRAYEGTTNAESFGFSAYAFKDSGGVYGFYTPAYAGATAGAYYICRYVSGAWEQTRFKATDPVRNIVLHPTDPYQCYLVANDVSSNPQVYLYSSADSGQTWTPDQQTDDVASNGDPVRVLRNVWGSTTCPFMYCLQTRTSASSWTSQWRAGMAVDHFIDEFLDTTTGDESANWGRQVNTSSSGFPIEAHPDDAARRILNVNLSGTDKTRCNRFLPCGTPQDAEVLVRWRKVTASGNYSAWVLARETGETSNNPGAYWRLGHVNDNIYANVNAETATTSAFSLTAGVWYYTRVRLSGATQKVKTWLATDDEPGAWGIEIARSTQNVGGDWGLVAFYTNTDFYVDWYALATGGATALFPDFDVTAANLVIANASHAHAADAQILSAVLNLTVSSAQHGHAADTADLTTLLSLTVQDALHAHSAEAVTLGAAYALAIADSMHGHTADSQTLSAALGLVVADALHSHAADALSLVSGLTLQSADSLHAHTADGLTLSAAMSLQIADALHAHGADAASLSAALSLIVADATHAHQVDGLSLDTGTALSIADAAHAHTADSLTLSAALSLITQSATHGHSATTAALSAALSLIVSDAVHAHAADGLALDTGTGLAIQDATHAHTADVLELSGALALAIQSAMHAHGADSVVLSAALTLAIEDALHAHGADNVSWYGETIAAVRTLLAATEVRALRLLRDDRVIQ